MPIEAICPNPTCASRYTVPESAAGRPTRCRACHQTFVISGSPTTDGMAPPERIPPAHTPPSQSELQTIGRFQVRGKLGAGAFGTVYHAYDPSLNRDIALKVPNPGTMDTPKRIERFLREAKAAAGLWHPNIVPVFDAGQDGDRYYIASAFIDGKPLSDMIEEKGTDFQRAAQIVRELAEALAYAHGQGIVHRDVKPQNIMVDTHGHIHLMDFGLASRHDEEARLTADGAVLGTPAYMAPEQAKGQTGEAQPATDQYAAGVVLYELLTGRTPFAGPLAVVLHQVIHAEPEQPKKLRPYVSKDLETICLKAMAKSPDHRYADCQALADDLRRWLEDEPITARRMGVTERAVRWVKKEPKLAGAMTAVALALLTSMVLVSGAAQQAARDAADARTAEQRAETLLGENQAARESEQRAMGETRSTLEKAAAARKQAVEFQAQVLAAQKLAEEYQRKATEEQKRFDGLRTSINGQLAEVSAARSKVTDERKKLEAEQLILKNLEPLLIQSAYQACQYSAFTDAGQLLQLVPPERRNWEWRHIQLLSNPEKKASARILLKTNTDSIASVAFGSGDSRLVSIANDKTVRIWDVNSGVELRAFKSLAPVTSATLSADGTFVVIRCKDKTFNVLDAIRGKQLSLLDWKGNDVNLRNRPLEISDIDPLVSEDGGVITTAVDGRIIFWGGKTRKNIGEWASVKDATAVAYAAANDYLEIGSKDGTIEILMFKGTKSTATSAPKIRDNGPITSLEFSPDGLRLVVASVGETIRMFKHSLRHELLFTYSPRNTSKEPPLFRPVFSPDGSQLLVDGEKCVCILDANTGKVIFELKPGIGFRPGFRPAFSPNGDRIVTGNYDHKTAYIWNSRTGERMLTLQYPSHVTSVAWSADGTKLAVGTFDGRIEIRDAGPAPPVLKPQP
jgi:WD40 repeat protein